MTPVVLDSAKVIVLQRFPVKSMGGESLDEVPVSESGLLGDREWAVCDADGRLASGKHSRRFRQMDPVFSLRARRTGDGSTVVVMPDGTLLEAGCADTDARLSDHFAEPVTLRRETGTMHQDEAPFSLVGTATLVELGRHEGDGRPLDPRHLRANVVVQTDVAYAEESWIGHELGLGDVRVRVTGGTQRCRMVGIAQVGLAERPDMLRTISARHDLMAGLYAAVLTPGRLAVGDLVRPVDW